MIRNLFKNEVLRVIRLNGAKQPLPVEDIYEILFRVKVSSLRKILIGAIVYLVNLLLLHNLLLNWVINKMMMSFSRSMKKIIENEIIL